MLGEIPMPADFRYREVFRLGKPGHLAFDSFSRRHPPMDRGRRAKIFSSFDALSGFSEAAAAKEVPYVPRRVPDGEDAEVLDRRLRALAMITHGSRRIRKPPLRLAVTVFVPCADPESPAFGTMGTYVTRCGFCRRVGPGGLLLDDAWIPLCDILKIASVRTKSVSDA